MRHVCGLLLLLWTVSWADASVNLTWNASSGATGYRLHYGQSHGVYDTSIDVGPSTTASLNGSLTVDATYFFAATAYNSAGESDYSNEVSKLITAADVTPPTVSITSPAPGSTVSRKGLVTIQANASDNVSVVSVTIRVNGQALCSDQSAPYQCSWAVPAPPNRHYQLDATAADAAGNVGKSAIVEVIAK